MEKGLTMETYETVKIKYCGGVYNYETREDYGFWKIGDKTIRAIRLKEGMDEDLYLNTNEAKVFYVFYDKDYELTAKFFNTFRVDLSELLEDLEKENHNKITLSVIDETKVIASAWVSFDTYLNNILFSAYSRFLDTPNWEISKESEIFKACINDDYFYFVKNGEEMLILEI